MKVRLVGLVLLGTIAIGCVPPSTTPTVPTAPHYWVERLSGPAPFSTRIAARGCGAGVSAYFFISPLGVEPILAGEGVTGSDGVVRLTASTTLPPGTYEMHGYCGGGGSASDFESKTVVITGGYTPG